MEVKPEFIFAKIVRAIEVRSGLWGYFHKDQAKYVARDVVKKLKEEKRKRI